MAELYPAVDMLGGKAVRLTQGDYSRRTEYDQDPLTAARRWVEDGARRLHVVDLDGARDGKPVNLGHLERIASALPVPVQYGGGIRTAGDAEAAFGAGAARIVLGTAAFTNEELLSELLREHGPRIAVGVDVRSNRVAIQGWQERTELSPAAAVERLVQRDVKTIVYTKVDWDGMMQGADIRLAEELAGATADRARFIYSGGIGTLADLQALAAMRLEQLEGVIVGKALYEGRFTVDEALEAL